MPPITLLDALLLAAAIYLAVFYLVYTPGPFDVFERFRTWVGITRIYDVEGNLAETTTDGYWADVFDCHRCATPYVSLPFIALWYFVPYAVYIIGVMGIAVWMAENSKTD